MTTSENLVKPQGGEDSQAKSAAEAEKHPNGTMFDPETIRKFLEQIKKKNP